MIEFFRDPLWQFIGALLTLVTIAISIFVFVKERAKKAVTYQIHSFYRFLSISEKEKGDFRVLYKGNEIQDLFLISLQIANTGNMPIASKDFERPIVFTFGESSKIFSVEVIATQPKTLSAELSIKNNKVVLSPLLLNSGDVIDIKCLVTSPQLDKIAADGRIIGVKEIVEKRVNIYRYLVWNLIGSIFMVLGIIGILATKPMISFERLQPIWPFLLLLTIGFTIGIIGMIGYYFNRGSRMFFELFRYLSSVFKNSK